MKTKNQIQKMGNDIEGMLNDFEGGITEKEKTIIDILDYLVQRAEATVNNFKKELSKSLNGRIKFYKENNRPDNASTLEILLRDMQNDELLSFMDRDGLPVEAQVKPANGEQEVDCWHCKEFEQHTNQRLGHCHKHKFDAKARIAKIIKCENFIHY